MLDRVKLAKILGLIGSAHDGEALAAARRAHDLVSAEKLTWSDAVGVDAVVAEAACRHLLAENEALKDELARVAAQAATTPVPWREPSSDAAAIDLCIQHTAPCTAWECEFIVSVAGQQRRLTEKQRNRLWQIVRKIERIGRARGAVV
jgi:hypothetical protein